jgi:hypothetical protein
MKKENTKRRTQLVAELTAVQGHSSFLKPASLVRWAASHPKSEAYKHFEWDDKKASAAYRLGQARELIRITVSIGAVEPIWVSLSVDRSKIKGYRKTTEVMRTKSLRKILLVDVMQEFIRLPKSVFRTR